MLTLRGKLSPARTWMVPLLTGLEYMKPFSKEKKQLTLLCRDLQKLIQDRKVSLLVREMGESTCAATIQS